MTHHNQTKELTPWFLSLVFDTNPGDLDGGPVFDSYINDQLLFNVELVHDIIDTELDVFAQ
jgi:hypothetical protein